jgi:hypothetical protein
MVGQPGNADRRIESPRRSDRARAQGLVAINNARFKYNISSQPTSAAYPPVQFKHRRMFNARPPIQAELIGCDRATAAGGVVRARAPVFATKRRKWRRVVKPQQIPRNSSDPRSGAAAAAGLPRGEVLRERMESAR